MRSLREWFKVRNASVIPAHMKEREKILDKRLDIERQKQAVSIQRNMAAAQDLEKVLACALNKNGNGHVD